MRFNVRDLRNTDRPLMRRLQRQVDLENEKKLFKNKDIDVKNNIIKEQNRIIEEENLLAESLFLTKSTDSFLLDGSLSEQISTPVLKPLLPYEKKLDYRKNTKLNLFKTRFRGR
jgi:hypothetical protein